MQQFKTTFLIIILFVILFLGAVLAVPASNQTDEMSQTIINTIYQTKNVLMRHSSPHDIERTIKQSIEMGAQGLKLAYPSLYPGISIKDMGWLVEDSKGREVFRVYFTFVNNEASNGRYLGPLISNKAAKGTDLRILSMHRDVLSKNLKQVSTDKYDIGDGCIASLTLSKYNSDPKRTIITVECH